MKTILFVVVVVCLAGCALFRKTSKTIDRATHSSSKQLESTELILKSTGKETQIFTYWNDSVLYQYQHINEQIDLAKSGKLNTRENQQAKQSVTVKKSMPVKVLIYIGLAAVLAIIFIVLFKIHKVLKFWHNK